MISLKKTTTLLLLLLITAKSYSQHYDRVLEELEHIRNSYSDSGYNSFTIKYQYAMESAPNKIMDTLTAYFKIKGQKYYCKMDKMEFIQNDSVNAAIYHNEKTIVLTNATLSTEKGRLMIDDWDSAFVAANIDSVSIINNKLLRSIHFYFTPESIYSNCAITYNKKTYQPQKITYVQRATQNQIADQIKPNGIVISILFSGFNKKPFNEMAFDYRKFVNNQNKKWTTASDFNSYSVVNNVYEK